MTILSGIVVDSDLISKNDWESKINELRSKCKVTVKDESKAVSLLHNSFSSAVKSRLPDKPFSVLLSGGVDSSAIAASCKSFNADFKCYSVGLKGSSDLEAAKDVASILNLKLVSRVFTQDEAANYLTKAIKIVPSKDPVSVGIGGVVLALNDILDSKTIFSGLGAEEIFGGYKRHIDAKNLNEECWQGLTNMWSRDLTRDFALAKHCNLNVLTPYLDSQLILAAMSISDDIKIKDSVKKYIFRKTAMHLGVPEHIAFRKKIAAQYGSGFHKALKVLSTQSGYKTIEEFLNS